tara:strand:+ start:64 stop:384 length:321 start_codon:yes stop_codon:yes gene_type:complete
MTAAAEFLSYSWVQALGWALLHFLWQGALLGLGAAGLMALPIFRTSQSRYGVALLTLCAMLAAPLCTLAVVYEPTLNLANPVANIPSDVSTPEAVPSVLHCVSREG